MNRSSISSALLGAAIVVTSFGCVSYPIIKPEAFSAKPKVAVVAYHSHAVTATLGLPIKIESIDTSYAEFSKALATQFEVVPVESIRNCQDYFKLPKLVMDVGSTAKGLEGVIVTQENAAGLAKCTGADMVVAVSGTPKVVAGFQVAGIGTSNIHMATEIRAFDNAGQEIWVDKLTGESESFKVAGTVMAPKDIDNAGVEALSRASTQAVTRFSQKLASSPAPAAAPATAEATAEAAPAPAPAAEPAAEPAAAPAADAPAEPATAAPATP